MLKKILSGIVMLGCAVAVQAANTGFDNASNPAYNADDANNANDGNPANNTNNWVTGDNGGTGFGAWTLIGNGNSSQTGFFMGSSAGNGNGSSGNINTAGRSWGMYANSGQTASAIRPLTGGSLLVGQTITLSIDNGFLDTGSSEGFGLQTSGGTNRMEFFFTGGNGSYTLADNTGNHATGIGFTTDGLSFAFTLTGADTYSLNVTPNGGSTSNFTGTLEGVAGTGIDQLRLFDFNGGNNQGSAGDFYANLLTVPEPSTWVAGGLTLLSLLFLRRRRVA
jgi:hypothetical protein